MKIWKILNKRLREARVTWLPHRTFTNHQGAKKKAFPKQNIVFWQISLLKTVFPTLDTLWSLGVLGWLFVSVGVYCHLLFPGHVWGVSGGCLGGVQGISEWYS